MPPVSRYWSGALLVRLASGMVYLDTTARRGVKYQYRVSLVDQSKHALAVFVSNVESFPEIASFPKLRLFEKSSNAKQVVIAWTSGRGKRASIFRAYRQDGLSGEFKPVAALSFLNARHDSTFYFIKDSVVKAVEVYRYYLSPMDYYGNPGRRIRYSYGRDLRIPACAIAGFSSCCKSRFGWRDTSVMALPRSEAC